MSTTVSSECITSKDKVVKDTVYLGHARLKKKQLPHYIGNLYFQNSFFSKLVLVPYCGPEQSESVSNSVSTDFFSIIMSKRSITLARKRYSLSHQLSCRCEMQVPNVFAVCLYFNMFQLHKKKRAAQNYIKRELTCKLAISELDYLCNLKIS